MLGVDLSWHWRDQAAYPLGGQLPGQQGLNASLGPHIGAHTGLEAVLLQLLQSKSCTASMMWQSMQCEVLGSFDPEVLRTQHAEGGTLPQPDL